MSSLFEVAKVEFAPRITDGEYHTQTRELEKGKAKTSERLVTLPELELPSSYGIYRTDDGAWLGTVGKSYQPVQPGQVFDALYEACGRSGSGLDCDKMKVLEMRGGQRLVFQIPLPGFEINPTNTPRKVGDPVSGNLEFICTFDGSASFQGSIFMKRLACTNGMTTKELINFCDGTERIKWKHTQGIIYKIDSLADLIHMTVDAYYKVQDVAQELADVPYKGTAKENDKFVEEVLGYAYADAKKEESARKINKFEQMIESIEHELPSAGHNLWGLLNGVTWFTNHIVGARRKDDKDHYLRFAEGATLTDKAVGILVNRARS